MKCDAMCSAENLEQYDRERRIELLQQRMSDLRTAYQQLRADVQAIDRRRKRAKQRERERADRLAEHSSSSGGSASASASSAKSDPDAVAAAKAWVFAINLFVVDEWHTDYTSV